MILLIIIMIIITIYYKSAYHKIIIPTFTLIIFNYTILLFTFFKPLSYCCGSVYEVYINYTFYYLFLYSTHFHGFFYESSKLGCVMVVSNYVMVKDFFFALSPLVHNPL